MRWLPLSLVALLACACTTTAPLHADPWQTLRQPDGNVLWLGEYRFVPPPESWQVLDLNDKDYSLALYKPCGDLLPGDAPCEATMAYAEEPFGHSREFEPRAREFLKRFLWAARIKFAAPQMTPAIIASRDALIVRVTGEEPVRHARVQARIVFMHRGDRVVAFFITQWRTDDTPFSDEDFAEFDRFVASFRFVKPSFYESL
jgi:hypothetical protein